MDILQEYERNAVLLAPDAINDPRIPPLAREYLSRARRQRLHGEPQMKAGFGPFRQMVDGAVVATADQTAITGTTEAFLYPAAQYTGFAANQLRPGQVWELSCFGVMTTPGSGQGNITITPRFGTSSGGTALGASAATALVASATDKRWSLKMWLIVRSAGLAGANSKVICSGLFTADVALIAAATGNVIPFGSTAETSVDLSAAGGIYIGVTLGSASDSMKCLSHPILESLN